MSKAYISVLLTLLLFGYINDLDALDLVAGKSGEEQVKDALERAQKESEEAARRDKEESSSQRKQQELRQYLKGRHDGATNHDLISSRLASVLDKKVQELSKYHGNRYSNHNTNQGNMEAKTTEQKAQEYSDIKDSMLETESDRKMVEMARKLNNLVQKFQRKIGRLSEGSRGGSYLDRNPIIASFLRSKRPLAPEAYVEVLSHLKRHSSLTPEHYMEEGPIVKSIRGHPKKPAIDLLALRKALGLLHVGNGKGDSRNNNNNEVVGSKTSYKEDTKLEDRLAMEAEEEKKFSNSDQYEYGGGGGGGSSKSSHSQQAQATFSPKEQASKEMESYNDLISSESNRELTQIQDEISKATQSSMGQVSVVGQKEHVQTESPEQPLGGIGSLDGIGSLGQDNGGLMGGNFLSDAGGIRGAIDASSIGPPGSSESFPGSAAANEALENALQSSANADMNGETMQPGDLDNPQDAEQGKNQEVQEMGNNSPIEIGGSMQEQQQEMNGMQGGNNPYGNSQ